MMIRAIACAAFIALVSPVANAGESWLGRSADLQNTGNAGYEPAIQPWTVNGLGLLHVLETDGPVNATPVVIDGLLVVGDATGVLHVIDLATQATLVRVETAGSGIQSAGVAGDVARADSSTEKRVYVGAGGTGALWCLSVTDILADRDELLLSPDESGDGYLCESPTGDLWPLSLQPSNGASAEFRGTPKLSENQPVCTSGCDGPDAVVDYRDVIYTPTTAGDCSNGEVWAIDAHTGERYWSFDAVTEGEGLGGVIQSTPALNADRTLVYVTTGACAGVPARELAGSLVALDAATGEVVWHHQRRLLDPLGYGIESAAVVADVEDGFEEPGCHVVVSSDENGCLYAFEQGRDIPAPGELGFDPTRLDQQRIRWRQCFVPGSPDGGFHASNLAFDDRRVMGQWSGDPFGVDDTNAVGVDVCTGRMAWASSDISNGRVDGAVASGYLFQLGATRRTSTGLELLPPAVPVSEIQVVGTDAGGAAAARVNATIDVSAAGAPTTGGGGIAIADGRLYVPMSTGVAVIGEVERGTSRPQKRGSNLHLGPYRHPLAPGLGAIAVPEPDTDEPNSHLPLILDKPTEAMFEYLNAN